MSSLSSLVVERGAATIRQVEEALTRQVIYGGDLAMNLLEVLGTEGEGRLASAIAAHHRLPHAPSGELPRAPDDVRRRIPADVAVRLGVYALAENAGELTIAVAEPISSDAEEALRAAARVERVAMTIALGVRIRQALARDYQAPLDRQTLRLLARLRGEPDPFPSSLPPSYRRTSQPPSARSEPAATRISQPPGARVEPAAIDAVSGMARDLAGWVRGAAAGGAARRRRGPLTLSEARAELDTSVTAHDALQTFFDFARQYFRFAAVFLVRGENAVLLHASSLAAGHENAVGGTFALTTGGCLALARERGAPLVAHLSPHDGDAVFTKRLGRPTSVPMLIAPVAARGRCVALLYADENGGAVELAEAGDVLGLAVLTGIALERAALRRKMGTAVTEPQSQRIRVATTQPLAEADSASKARAAKVLASALRLPEGATTASPTQEAVGGSTNEASRREHPPTEAPYAVPEPQHGIDTPRVALAETAPPSEVAEGPPDSGLYEASTVEVPAIEDDAPTVVIDGSNDEADAALGVPTSVSHQPSAHDRVTPSEGASLRIAHEAQIDRLLAAGPNEAEQLDGIARAEASITAALLARLPGPMACTHDDLVNDRVSPYKAGPLFRAVLARGRTALPFVTTHAASASVDARLYATFLLGALRFDEAAVALAPRLFDSSPDVQRVARHAARRLGPGQSMTRPVIRALEGTLLDAGASDERRAAAAEALADLRHGPSVGALLDALEWADPLPSPALLAAFHRALVTLARRDLGRAPNAWLTWWRQHGREPRTMWLLDALANENASSACEAAAKELAEELSLPSLTRYTELDDHERARLREQARGAYVALSKRAYEKET